MFHLDFMTVTEITSEFSVGGSGLFVSEAAQLTYKFMRGQAGAPISRYAKTAHIQDGRFHPHSPEPTR